MELKKPVIVCKRLEIGAEVYLSTGQQPKHNDLDQSILMLLHSSKNHILLIHATLITTTSQMWTLQMPKAQLKIHPLCKTWHISSICLHNQRKKKQYNPEFSPNDTYSHLKKKKWKLDLTCASKSKIKAHQMHVQQLDITLTQVQMLFKKRPLIFKDIRLDRLPHTFALVNHNLSSLPFCTPPWGGCLYNVSQSNSELNPTGKLWKDWKTGVHR